MLKLLFLPLFLTTISCMAQTDEIKLLHFNIKELDSKKINNAASNSQMVAVKSIIDQFDADIISFNEIQYDMPNVPDSSYNTKGQNLQKLKSFLNLKKLNEESFNIANTGLNAKTKADGTYYLKPNSAEARGNADQVNFGTVPGQYSTGALLKYKKINEIVIDNLKWKDFNPNINLQNFATASGEPLPDDMELFDKNFTDVVLDVNGKELHLILLHTVPAYHFGNQKSVNYIRNAEQLKFLEWYLTGSTDIKVDLPNIKPLKKDAYFVAVGDWNTEYSNTTNPGSIVLRRMFSKTQLWLKDIGDLSFTNEGNAYSKKPFRLMLDYIAYSKNIEIINSKIVHPKFDHFDLGCSKETNNIKKPQDFVIVEYKEKGKICKAYVHKSYKLFVEASDHYPIWGHFKLK